MVILLNVGAYYDSNTHFHYHFINSLLHDKNYNVDHQLDDIRRIGTLHAERIYKPFTNGDGEKVKTGAKLGRERTIHNFTIELEIEQKSNSWQWGAD